MKAEEIRTAILTADDRPREPLSVDVPWKLNGDKLYVAAVTFQDYKPYLTEKGGFKIDGDVMARLVVRCIVTEDGERVFRDNDARALADKDARLVTRLFAEVMRVSALTDERAEAVEEGFGQAQHEEPSTG